MAMFSKCKLCGSRQCHGHTTRASRASQGNPKHSPDQEFQTKGLKPMGSWSRVRDRRR
jgi:hypothetical protein